MCSDFGYTEVTRTGIGAHLVSRGFELLGKPGAISRVAGNSSLPCRTTIAEKVTKNIWFDGQVGRPQNKRSGYRNRVVSLTPGPQG
jgi:hypothetical protein